MFTIEEILDMAIRIEENGEEFYRQALEHVTDPNLGPVLRCLAEEEVRHQQLFRTLREAPSSEHEGRWLVDLSGSMLKDIVGNQTFSLREVDPTHFTSEQTILEAAMEFEDDTILFLEMLRDFVVDDETLQQLNDLITEERRHKETLRDCLHCRKSVCKELKYVTN